MSYRDKLQRELSRIRSVADDFEAALRVEALLNGTGEPPTKVLELKADQPKKASAKITIRKITGPAVGQPQRRSPDKEHRAAVRERVMQYVREHGSAQSGDLLQAFGLADGTKQQKQVLYQVMYDLRRLEQLVRGDDMVYRLP